MKRLFRAWWLVAIVVVAGCDSADSVSDSAEPVIEDVGAIDGGPVEDVAPVESMVDWVDPRIGTGGRGWYAGNAFVGATLPFGMVQVGPDTTDSVKGYTWAFDHCSGYHASDDWIEGFSHTH
ncbi:MAG: putative alpha-1,2-mannosidase, partial [Myxococcota bacterium]